MSPTEFTAENAENAETVKALNEITRAIIGAAIEVHRQLGPGLFESTYEARLVYELVQAGLRVERQKELPVIYKGMKLDCGYRMDLLVANAIVVELKAVEHLDAIHEAQLLSYLRLSGRKVGLLINFNVYSLNRSIRRLVNGLSE